MPPRPHFIIPTPFDCCFDACNRPGNSRGFIGFLGGTCHPGTHPAYSSSPSRLRVSTLSCFRFPFFLSHDPQPAAPLARTASSHFRPPRSLSGQQSPDNNDVFQHQPSPGSCSAGCAQPAFRLCCPAASPLCGAGWGCHRVRLLCLLSHTPHSHWHQRTSRWACSGTLMNAMRPHRARTR